MDETHVVAGAVGLTLLASVPRMAAPSKADPLPEQTDVVAAADLFIDLGPVTREARDRAYGRRSHTVPEPPA